MRRGTRLLLLYMACGLVLGHGRLATAQELHTSGFHIQYDGAGIRSLKRTGDTYDTDSIAANGRLGRLMVRYRGTSNGDWRELQEMLLRSATSSSIHYELGRLLPTLALSDGIVPAPRDVPGRGAPPPARDPSAPDVPTFSWTVGANEPGAGGTGPAGVIGELAYGGLLTRDGNGISA